VEVTAEKGEFEESREKALLDNFSPRADKVGKIKDEVAQAAGKLASWTFTGEAEPVHLPDGSRKMFPAGSVTLQQCYDPYFPWPEYKWPKGSL
jgi:hypothetical protein